MKDHSIDLLDFILALRRYRWLVIVFISAGLLLGWARSGDQSYSYYSVIQHGWVVESGRLQLLRFTDDINQYVNLAIEPDVTAQFMAKGEGDERYLKLSVDNEQDLKFVTVTTRAPGEQGELQRAYHQAVVERILGEQLWHFESELQRYNGEWGVHTDRLKALRADAVSRAEVERLQALAEMAKGRWAAFGEERGEDSALPEWTAEKLALQVRWKDAELKVQRVIAAHNKALVEQQRIVDTYKKNAKLFAKPRIVVVAKPSKIIGGKPVELVIALGAILGLVLGMLAVFGLTLYQGIKRMISAHANPRFVGG